MPDKATRLAVMRKLVDNLDEKLTHALQCYRLTAKLVFLQAERHDDPNIELAVTSLVMKLLEQTQEPLVRYLELVPVETLEYLQERMQLQVSFEAAVSPEAEASAETLLAQALSKARGD